MSQNNAPHELYIEQVKTEEKKKKRRYLLLLLLLLLLGIIGGGGIFNIWRSSEGLEYRTYNKTDLDLTKFKGILADKNVRIRVLDYERGRLDTISTVEEYRAIYDNGGIGDGFPPEDSTEFNNSIDPSDYKYQDEEPGISQNGEGNNSDEFTYSDGNDNTSRKGFEEVSGPLKQFQLDIIGKRVAGEILSFIITDYNPSIRYNLDFGNGIIQEAKEITLYMYPASGRFTLNLTATDPQFNRSKTSEYLEIKNRNNASIVENTDDANNTYSTEPSTQSDWEPVTNTNTNTNTTDSDISRDQSPDGSNTSDNISGMNNLPAEDKGIEQPTTTPATEEVNTNLDASINSDDIKRPVLTAQKQPSFPGGTKSMYSFLNQHIEYPQQARDFEVEGKVYVQFEVDTKGNIKHPKVVKKLGYGCDEEALRIVQLMPKWEPAKNMGQEVPYLYTLPVTFRLIE
ncbi:MAG: TonB family protein [Bacteroidota bacterium]